MLRIYVSLFGLLFLAACGTREPAPLQAGDTVRGALLYDTACVQCHTTQAHWRDKSIVASWETLVAEVSRWQKISGQRWSDGEIQDVAAYLNQRFYKMPAPRRAGG